MGSGRKARNKDGWGQNDFMRGKKSWDVKKCKEMSKCAILNFMCSVYCCTEETQPGRHLE